LLFPLGTCDFSLFFFIETSFGMASDPFIEKCDSVFFPKIISVRIRQDDYKIKGRMPIS
jgi:hypothetical protein